MLASQSALDLKRKYVSENQALPGSNNDIPLPGSYKPEAPIEPLQNGRDYPNHQDPPNQPIEETQPHEEPFKMVHNDLKLNQSAMLPKDPKAQDENKETATNKKLEDLADKSDSVLLKVSTVFPFTFFVNDIIIDPYKVNIIFREFFYSEHIHSIMVKDILDVVVETSLFFATVKIVDQGYVENTVDITYLKKEDALKVRKVIQGLVIAHRQAVDLSVLPKADIQEKAQELGKVKGIDDSIRVEPQFI